MARPSLEVADIFRQHAPAWRAEQRGHLSLAQLKVMSAIEQCRSAALGGHVLRCEGYLNAQHRLLAVEELFRGTLTQTSVYPREVLREALRHGGPAVLLIHCHPSLQAEPSRADEHLTRALAEALKLIDVQVLDHIVVGGTSTVSMAERGLL